MPWKKAQRAGGTYPGSTSLSFGIFLALALVSLAFVYALAPETRGRPLEAIRSYWCNGGRWPEETGT